MAVVGGSGAGKTTLLNLLLRFYDPDRGSVQIDGVDLRALTQQSFRSHVGVVLQANFLFNDTIRANVRIGDPQADDETVELAIRRAQLHAAVQRMPDGLDTVVGEQGGRLSGGQRQRLAIARALVRDPAILLLDEVTAALDPATERAVNAMLADVAYGRTVVSVTHRLASASQADHILVMDHGRLVGQGTHDDLLRAGGVYADLWEKQSGFHVSGDGRTASVSPARLRHITLFADLADEVLARIAGLLASEYFEGDQVVFREGDEGERFFLIARGRVEVSMSDADGAERVLDRLIDGDHFGELALLQNRPRTATVRTESPSVFLTMSRSSFLLLVNSTPDVFPVLQERIARYVLNVEE
ncbi:MAG: ATP-binding cassette domain-containing protein [Sporichthyaceae bacterium]